MGHNGLTARQSSGRPFGTACVFRDGFIDVLLFPQLADRPAATLPLLLEALSDHPEAMRAIGERVCSAIISCVFT